MNQRHGVAAVSRVMDLAGGALRCGGGSWMRRVWSMGSRFAGEAQEGGETHRLGEHSDNTLDDFMNSATSEPMLVHKGCEIWVIPILRVVRFGLRIVTEY